MATWALIENADPLISYSGPWIQLISKDLNFDISGSSAHYILPGIINSTTSPASLSFEFTGSEIAVFGVASIFNNTLPVPGPGPPVWECLVDGKSIPNNNPYGMYPLESYCFASGLTDDTFHSFELRLTDSGSGFWIDFLRYLVPSELLTIIPPNTTAWRGASDSRLGTTAGAWIPIGDGFMTSGMGSVATEDPVLTTDFVGSSLTWYGLTKAAMGIAKPSLPVLSLNTTSPQEGFYTIDDSERHSFSANIVDDIAHANTNPYNIILFTTPVMDTGTHNLKVYYDVDSAVWPLTLDSLTITHGFKTNVEMATAGVTPPAKSNKAAIIGGVFGAVLGGILIMLFTLFVRRRWYIKRGEHIRSTMLLNIEHNDVKMQPFSGTAE